MTDRSIHRSEVAEPEDERAELFSEGLRWGSAVACLCMVGAAAIFAVAVSLVR